MKQALREAGVACALRPREGADDEGSEPPA
jgi:hypothetical protein